MTVFLRWAVVLCQLISFGAFAQLTVTSPVPRMVFQRDLDNQATILVTGMAPPAATSIEARVVPLAIGQGSVSSWTTLNRINGSTTFRGTITAQAGWYRLDVRAKTGTTLIAQTQVNRVGIGEVFIVAGQSNAAGGFQRPPNSVEDRVMTLDFRQDSLSEQLLPLRFSNTSYGANIGPSQPPHIWGPLGDKLVQRLNVPVLFLGAALGGTTSSEWQQSAAGNIGTSVNLAVYRRLGVVLLHYALRTGVRAVLWHQGEGDISSTTQQYFNNVKYVIEKSRQQVGNRPLPWVVSRVSYTQGQTNPLVIAAQNQLISNVPNVFAGPATDFLTGYDNRGGDDVHFRGAGFFRFIDTWDQSLTTAFFQQAPPLMPTDSTALITSGYTLPLTRRPGETVAVASLRSDAHEPDNQYIAQIVRVSDGNVVFESAPSTDNPILITLPFTLTNGQYQLRTKATHPVLAGSLGEPFMVQQDATPSPAFTIYRTPISGGTADSSILRFGYGYDMPSHGLLAMVQATAPVEVRVQRIDGGSFADSGWGVAPPSSQAPDSDWNSDFNYIRYYPAQNAGIDGVIPGARYRISVRKQGDTSAGLWYETVFLQRRNILYYPMEPTGPIPPVLTLNEPVASACLSGTVNVVVDVTDNVVNRGNMFSVRLSDVNGSFTNETTIGSGSTSPISLTLSPSLPAGTNYRIRIVASNPAVASAPSQPLSICAGGADLSLNMSVSNRTPTTSQPVTITMVLANAGPFAATNVRAQSILPAGMAFVDSPSGNVSASANTVTIQAGSLPVGSRQPFVFRVRASQSGSYATSAQITASGQFDADSQPNSGTGDGQDDEATVDMRTPDASGPQIRSPNSNQAAPPIVQSNQPPTDSAKADLSLNLSASKLVVSSGEVMSVTLVCSNRGGATASNVSLQTLLPTGWRLNVTTGLTINGQTITVPIGTIPAGGSKAMVLQVRVSGSGTIRSQVLSATPIDSDSTPGNGLNKGEDDEASLSLRVR
ncbi:sialate O-acetylesterase [Spirosoma pollinicola]|nr:sialate O-acetylesterase [Spirosoma pollinicola]